jgi:hypothetical protein
MLDHGKPLVFAWQGGVGLAAAALFDGQEANDRTGLRQERPYHVPIHVREAEVATLVAGDEPQVVQA